MTKLALAAIRPDPRYRFSQLETGGGKIRVNAHRAAIRDGKTPEPIEVDASGMIVNGHHRWRAHVLEGRETIAVTQPAPPAPPRRKAKRDRLVG